MTYVIPKTTAYAESQVGVHEVPDGSNCQGYSDWQYGVRCPGGGWCISFLSRCTVEGGYRFDGATHGPRGFSFTGAAEAWARARGLWRDKNWRAQPGDWVIFNWDGGQTDHGEMVWKDDGRWMVLIGGNTSNAVKFRKRDRHYVVGIVAFSQSSQAGPPPPPPPPPAPKIKEYDMVILPGAPIPASRIRWAAPASSGQWIWLMDGAKVLGMSAPVAGDPKERRRWYPKNADGSNAGTTDNPLIGLTKDAKYLIAGRLDGGVYRGEIDAS